MEGEGEVLVSLLDTSVASENLGDRIIVEAVEKVVRNTLPEAFVVTVPTHESMGRRSLSLVERSAVAVVAGTNLLSSHMWGFGQWRVGLLQALRVHDLVLCGVGWWQYQDKPDLYTRLLFRRILSDRWMHSVRDSYTRERLEAIGFDEVANTSCPSMWELDERVDCGRSPADTVVTTLTTYSKDPDSDRHLLRVLGEEYDRIFFWPQQHGDRSYFRRLGGAVSEEATVLPASLDAFDRVLTDEVDYVGTRLHGGIRSLQHGNRTIIVAIDNRAREIANDTGLPVVSRDDPDRVPEKLRSLETIFLELPTSEIRAWKRQFRRTLDGRRDSGA